MDYPQLAQAGERIVCRRTARHEKAAGTAKGLGVQMRLMRWSCISPRQWGACWLACHIYEQLELDWFFAPLLPDSREGTNP